MDFAQRLHGGHTVALPLNSNIEWRAAIASYLAILCSFIAHLICHQNATNFWINMHELLPPQKVQGEIRVFVCFELNFLIDCNRDDCTKNADSTHTHSTTFVASTTMANEAFIHSLIRILCLRATSSSSSMSSFLSSHAFVGIISFCFILSLRVYTVSIFQQKSFSNDASADMHTSNVNRS